MPPPQGTWSEGGWGERLDINWGSETKKHLRLAAVQVYWSDIKRDS